MPRHVGIYGIVLVLIILGAIAHPRALVKRNGVSVRQPSVSYNESIDVSGGGAMLQAQWLSADDTVPRTPIRARRSMDPQKSGSTASPHGGLLHAFENLLPVNWRRAILISRPRKTDVTFTCNFGIEADEGLWDWTYNAYLYDTGNNQIAQRTNWIANKPGMNGSVSATLTDPPDGQYECTIEWWVETYDLGQRIATTNYSAQVPTSLTVSSPLADVCGNPPTCQPPGCTGGCQAYYYKNRSYQVMDGAQPPQAIQKVMTMDESFTTPQNTCNASFAEGSATTNSSGVFTDSFFFFGNSICDGGGSCTVQRNQTWKEHASGNTVGTYSLTYTCNSFSIQ